MQIIINKKISYLQLTKR